MRLRLVKQNTSFDFFTRWKLWLGISGVMVLVAAASFLMQGLNFGIDFRGGTTIRTESPLPVDIAVYRDAMTTLGLGDITITEVFDPSFRPDQNVAMVRIQAQDDQEAVTTELIETVEAALVEVRPDIKFISVESVGPKVSGELINTAIIAVVLAIGAVLIYIWLRFEWQFAAGAVLALIHDVVLTIGVFSELQIRFDL
ncbi:MAG: protein translocase subunit SecF, partial [Sulfitobacter sp.]